MYHNFPIVEGGKLFGDSKNPMAASSSFDPQLFLGINEYVDHLLVGSAFAQHKYFPVEVAQWLEDLATAAASNLAIAKSRAPKPTDPAFRRLEADVAIQSCLGWFFARKFRSAVLWSIYQKSGDAKAKAAALEQYAKARAAWADLVTVAKPIYQTNVAYGHEPHMHGHWAERLKGIDDDINAMTNGGVVGTPAHPGSVPAANRRCPRTAGPPRAELLSRPCRQVRPRKKSGNCCAHGRFGYSGCEALFSPG
jgi:hypothetical protein